MAGDWIKFEVSTPDKPEVWDMAERLNLEPDAIVGKLLRVWCWFDAQTENGHAPTVTKKLLDREVGVTGFCDCMIKVGWMQEKGGVYIPNFDRHNGQSAKNRALSSKRQAKHRASLTKESQKNNAVGVTNSSPEKRRDREEIEVNNKEKGDKSPSKRKRFSPPTFQEVSDYFFEKCGDSSDAQTFINFYESKGWMVGKNKMKDWRAAVRNWIGRKKESPKKESNNDYLESLANKRFYDEE